MFMPDNRMQSANHLYPTAIISLEPKSALSSGGEAEEDHVAVFEAGELIAEWKRKDVEVEREGGDLRDQER